MAAETTPRTKTRTRRHTGFGPQRTAREDYLATRGPAARRRRALERLKARANRGLGTDLEHLRARVTKEIMAGIDLSWSE